MLGVLKSVASIKKKKGLMFYKEESILPIGCFWARAIALTPSWMSSLMPSLQISAMPAPMTQTYESVPQPLCLSVCLFSLSLEVELFSY